MISLKQFLEHKGGEIWSVTSESSVLGALQKMAEKNIGALLVIDEGKLVGILSERDYARKVALMGKVSKDTAVKEIMTQRVLYVRPDESIEDCMALMT
ncbi:MAG: histidine kinase, partial [Elusimicrobia bacterium RIFCSPLOWO2_02_FULL_61_11]